MTSKWLLIAFALPLVCGCAPSRPRLLPEISPPLAEEEIVAWSGKLAGARLFPCAGGIGWVDAAGRVMVCDLERRQVTVAFRVPFAVDVPPFQQGDFLVLQESSSQRLLVYDLEAAAVRFESQRLPLQRLLGAGALGLVYVHDGRPAVRLWQDPARELQAPEGDEEYFGCHFAPGRILLLGRTKLFTLDAASGRFAVRPLPEPAASPALVVGSGLYYGSSRRRLLKVGAADLRPRWRLPLGQLLRRRPLAFAGSIVISPDDNTLMQVNANGTLLWWQALGSTLGPDLLPLSEHLAAVLLSGEVKFIDPRRQRSTSFAGMKAAVAPPLACGGRLCYFAADGNVLRLLRLGNRVAVDIVLEAAPVRWLGRSLAFAVQPVNLLSPRWRCTIVDEAGRTVFDKSGAGAQRAALAWVPQRPGTHVIRVKAVGTNQEAQSEAAVRILDPRQLAPVPFLGF